jgi:hypothetical protein
MLSYLYRLANGFEGEHGYRPNVLYLNRHHFSQLRTDLANIHGLGELVHFLGMEIVIDSEVTHPRVSYSMVDWEQAIAV